MLRDALFSLKYDNKDTVSNNRENAIVIACLTAHIYNCVDEMLFVVKKNDSKTLDEVMEILSDEGFFPEPEIVDDEFD